MTTAARLEHPATIDLDARPAPGGPPGAPITRLVEPTARDAAALRDHLTRRHLAQSPDGPAEGARTRFRRRWWDGSAWVPTLVVRSAQGRYRITTSTGTRTALPANPWRARRALARVRRAAICDPELVTLARTGLVPPQQVRLTIDLRDRRDGVPTDRPTPPRLSAGRHALRRVVRIDAPADAVRCRDPRCSALVPIPPPGRLADSPSCSACGCGI